jgi:hypothetical protein
MSDNASLAVHRSRLDALGVALSVACAMQCAALPILISVLPFPLLAGVLPFVPAVLLPGGGFDRIALAASIVLAAGTFSWGFRWHRQVYIFAVLSVAMSLIGFGSLWVPGRHQIAFVVAGALILAAGHVLNRRLCRLCHLCQSTGKLSRELPR